jgi:hypothetical protein
MSAAWASTSGVSYEHSLLPLAHVPHSHYSSLWFLMILKQQVDHCMSIGVGVRGFALPRACHIKHLNVIMLYERDEQERRAFSGDLLGVNEFVGLVLFDAKQECLLGAALNLGEIEDRCSIALRRIPQGRCRYPPSLSSIRG